MSNSASVLTISSASSQNPAPLQQDLYSTSNAIYVKPIHMTGIENAYFIVYKKANELRRYARSASAAQVLHKFEIYRSGECMHHVYFPLETHQVMRIADARQPRRVIGAVLWDQNLASPTLE